MEVEIINLILCHLVGDYVLQCDFIAKTKGDNMYHLIVHCILYTLPFYLLYGISPFVSFILGSHLIIDALKARWKVIDYKEDQRLHYLFIVMGYILLL